MSEVRIDPRQINRGPDSATWAARRTTFRPAGNLTPVTLHRAAPGQAKTTVGSKADLASSPLTLAPTAETNEQADMIAQGRLAVERALLEQDGVAFGD